MPFGRRAELAAARGERCAHCPTRTDRACLACAQLVCPDCEERHDRESRHRAYGEI
ncbi:MAG: hypothetical protein OXC94_07045 [Chloroflexi bacterium]|nr:hypothetical protein [Chloroflexota bacterium]